VDQTICGMASVSTCSWAYPTIDQSSGSPRVRSRAAGLPQHLVQVGGRQAVAGPDRADIGLGQRLAGLHVGGDVERAAELAVGLLRAQQVVMGAAQRLPGVLAVVDQGRELDGSRLKAASGPPSDRARVKCFSTAQAPSETAATEAAVPGV
jgi:hypothetical protein